MGRMKELDIRIRQGGDDAIAAVSELLPRWIPVDERLPEDGQRVLAVTRVGGITEVGEFAFNSRGEWFSTDYGSWNASHWMPLPEPPEVT
jgi:hypothetical protein